MPLAHSRSPSPQEEHHKRGRIACVTCRQAKVRCDFVAIPCPRCERLQLDCIVDRGFKRTTKRDKVNELEDNVQRLQNLIEKQQNEVQLRHETPTRSIAPESLEGNFGSNSINQYRLSGTPGDNPNRESSTLSPRQPPTTTSSTEGRSLDSVSLKHDQIDKLFNIYLEKYHVILPIINPNKTPTEFFEMSSVLFWTIICIASRSYQEDTTLLSKLMPVLSTLVWTYFGASTRSVVGVEAWNVSELQAVLLLASWPLPYSRFWSDRSLLMSNIALTCGMHMGLHRPGYELDYLREPPQDLNPAYMMERTSVWVAAYSLCVSQSCEYGHVPLVPPIDWTTKKVCSRNPEIEVPSELRHLTIIQRQANDTFTTFFQMNENPAHVASEPSFLQHMLMFEKVFTDLGNAYLDEMSLCNKIFFYGTMLLLQAMYFLADQSLDESKQGVLRAYATATTLINTLISDDTTNDFLPCAPQATLRAILRSGFVIMKIVFSSYSDSVDVVSSTTLFNTAVFLIRQMSIRPKENDQPVRAANALKLSWKRMETDATKAQSPTLLIRSRLGASLTYDCLVQYREIRKAESKQSRMDLKNGQPQFQATLPGTTAPSARQSLNTTLSPPAVTPGSDNWSAASFEALFDSDLSWLDSWVYPGVYSGL